MIYYFVVLYGYNVINYFIINNCSMFIYSVIGFNRVINLLSEIANLLMNYIIIINLSIIYINECACFL